MTAAPDPHPFLPPLTRRSFLGGVGAATATLAALAAGAPRAFATSAGTVLPLVTPLPAGAPDRTAFDPHEQVFASYLMILAPLANSVVDDDPERYGWMEDGWWRSPNEPFNSRIMEHVATLSWFYAHARPWNPYHLDPNLLGRLDAALTYYLGLQHDDGSWPEYRWEEHGLASTGFGTVALSATLRDLIAVGALPDRRTEIEAAIRASSAWLVDLARPHWALPVQYANQVVAGLAGVAQAATVLGDPSLSAALPDRCALLLEQGQAPAGYFHEPLAYDAGYNFDVMLPDLGDLYAHTEDPSVVELARRWARWFGYVVVLEPGETYGFHVAAASARNATTTFFPRPGDATDRVALGRVFLPLVPELGAFYSPTEEKTAARAAWSVSPDPVEPRAKQDTSPRLYMHVPQAPAGVDADERDARVAQLPYLRDDTFTEVREGTIDQHVVFVRRPAYYLAGQYGVRPYNRQRMGPALLWHPEAGTVVLTLNNFTDDSWNTIAATGVESARSAVVATHHDGPDAAGPEIPRSELHAYEGVFTTRYVTEDGTITTDVAHWHDGIRRTVSAAGAARDQLPLVLRDGDELALADGTPVAPGGDATATTSGLVLTRAGVRFVFSWGTDLPVTLTATDRVFFPDASRRQHVLTVAHAGTLTTEITAVRLAELEPGELAVAATAHAVRNGDRHRTAVHVTNLEDGPVAITIRSSAGSRTHDGVAPGAGVYELFDSSRPVRHVVVSATAGGPVTVRRIRL
ncbi:hypothetical protein [Jiangella endophytica]|uniref:hypothetical protein n=1 Tax=Jiangella endophytica TaxID=1623398 RepID=UPI000E348813|nr:hypothetical protein [Jiangella endophytica]